MGSHEKNWKQKLRIYVEWYTITGNNEGREELGDWEQGLGEDFSL